MKNTSLKLAMLLAVQLGLVFFFWKSPSNTDATQGSGSLLTVSVDSLQSIKISERQSDEESVEPSAEVKALTFQKVDGTWVMPDHDGFPVSSDKLNKVLGSLSELQRGWPVGKTDIAARTLKTTEDTFEKSIELSTEDESNTLFLGTSPGFRKVHARLKNDDRTWAVVLNSWDFPLTPMDWRSQKVYEIPRSQVQNIHFHEEKLTFHKTDKGFSLKPLDEGYETNAQAFDAVLKVALSPRYENLYSAALPKDAQIWASWTVAFEKSGEAIEQQFQVWSAESEENLILKSSLHPWFFTVSRESLAEVKNMSKDRMMQKTESQASENEQAPESSISNGAVTSDS